MWGRLDSKFQNMSAPCFDDTSDTLFPVLYVSELQLKCPTAAHALFLCLSTHTQEKDIRRCTQWGTFNFYK